jgi:hypothetical protein
MGRKQKLRQERKIKNKNSTSAEVAATSEATSEPSEAAIAEEIDIQFPKSDEYIQSTANTHIINGIEHYALNNGERYQLFKQGAAKHGCVHSMRVMGEMQSTRMHIHLAVPWLLEGAIRGSVECTVKLLLQYYIDKTKPYQHQKADALQDYWGEIINNTDTRLPNFAMKEVKHRLGRNCVICSKTDTKTLTLQQCRGCSYYCYCSETCQTTHWEERNHRGECKQLRILNKYHKPYAKAIRDATIRGDIHPALEKLRYKLGLTRPLEDYHELMHNNTQDGKPINPRDYVVAREDGTVWVGSIPISIGTS